MQVDIIWLAGTFIVGGLIAFIITGFVSSSRAEEAREEIEELRNDKQKALVMAGRWEEEANKTLGLLRQANKYQQYLMADIDQVKLQVIAELERDGKIKIPIKYSKN